MDDTRPESLYEALDEVAIFVEGVQVPVQRKMVYPERPGPDASVDGVQARDMVEVPVPVAERAVGVVGGVVSTVTVVVAVEVPFVFVAESV